MVKIVYKYELAYEVQEHKIDLPKGAEILTVAFQRGKPHLWALVNANEEESEERTVLLCGTGHPLDLRDSGYILNYINTVYVEQYIWHLFEKVKG